MSPKKSNFSGDSQKSTFEESSEDMEQADEQPHIDYQMNKYNANFNLLTGVKDNNSNSTNSSINNTPILMARNLDPPKGFQRKAMNIQGNLINLIRAGPTEKPAFTVSAEYKDEGKLKEKKERQVQDVKKSLMGMH